MIWRQALGLLVVVVLYFNAELDQVPPSLENPVESPTVNSEDIQKLDEIRGYN